MKRVLPVMALLAVAACDGVDVGAFGSDGGTPCLVPTVMPLSWSEGDTSASALVEVNLGDAATGPDPVMLTWVHLRPISGGTSLRFVEAAQVSVRAGAGRARSLLAAGGTADEDGSILLFPVLDTEVDLRVLAAGGPLPLHLELAGTPPGGKGALALELCVRPITPRGRL